MKKLHKTHEEATDEMFRRDPSLAVDYVNAVLDDTDADEAELLLALRSVSRAFGGVQAVAQLSGLNPNTLYRTFSSRGNPELRTLNAVLKVMGMRLSVQPLSRACDES